MKKLTATMPAVLLIASLAVTPGLAQTASVTNQTSVTSEQSASVPEEQSIGEFDGQASAESTLENGGNRNGALEKGSKAYIGLEQAMEQVKGSPAEQVIAELLNQELPLTDVVTYLNFKADSFRFPRKKLL
jgi:hypothetical protein